MDLGATVCGKPAPGCARCPVAALCAARRAGLERDVPPARKRPARRPLVLGCAVVRCGGTILLARRPAGGLLGGLWSLPWAELRSRDDPRRALAQALRGEHGVRASVREELAACERTLTHRALTLRAFRCELRGPVRETARLRFVSRSALGGMAIPAATRALLGHLVPAAEEGWSAARRAFHLDGGETGAPARRPGASTERRSADNLAIRLDRGGRARIIRRPYDGCPHRSPRHCIEGRFCWEKSTRCRRSASWSARAARSSR